MKKTSWVLLVIFALLAFATYYILRQEDNTARSGDEFAIANTAKIGKIVMWDKMKNRVTLTKTDGEWYINDKYLARKASIDLLLKTFNQLRVTAQVPRAAEENIRRDINVNGIITEIYDQNDQPLKTLYVGNGAPDSRGTYMMQRGGKYPYEVSLPNFTGVLRPRFMLNEIDWRDRTVFSIPDDKIKTVRVEYFEKTKKEKSFYLIRNGNHAEVQKLYGLPMKGLPDDGKCMYYLKSFEQIGAEAFENDNPKRQALKNAVPFCEITVMNTKGEEHSVKLFPLKGRQMGETNDGKPIRANVERYFASINDDEDFMLVQDRVFKRILAPIEFFYEKE